MAELGDCVECATRLIHTKSQTLRRHRTKDQFQEVHRSRTCLFIYTFHNRSNNASESKKNIITPNLRLPSYTLWFKAPLALRCPTTTCNDARYRATPKAKRGAAGRAGAGATGGTGGPGTTETTTSADGTSWDITGFEGLITVKYQKQTLSNTFWLLFVAGFCGIYRRIEENVSFYLGFEYHQKETLSLSQLFKTLRKTRVNLR